MSKALYRTYRSKSLSEVVGQSHVTDILARAIAAGRISHAYLLTGPKGVGKTSIARILAHEINGLPYEDDSSHLDIIEIDAASNNGVEDVRDLREKVQIAPTSAKHKVYIIDEVHMLSKAAFNALLKTLEEPPEHVVFILATTDVDKLPATIISRTQRFSFRSISTADAVKHLRHIADSEKIKIDDDALQLIAERGDGSFRDSISLLDQLSSLTDSKTGITTELIEASIDLAPKKMIDQLIETVESHDIPALVAALDGAFDQGISGGVLASQLTQRVREMVVEKPQLLPLLDSLLDVAKSPQPNLKLLSVLGTAATPKQVTKTVALAAPVLEVSATIEELEKQATRKKPIEKPATMKVEETTLETSMTPLHEGDAPDRAGLAPQATSEAGPVERLPNANGGVLADQSTTELFDPAKLIEYTREHYVAVYSVLSKCTFELDGNMLTIYAGNKFYKKKLDDTKYAPILSQSLETLGYKDLEIHTIPTAHPPSDEQAFAVAAIMGGGEEVSVETV